MNLALDRPHHSSNSSDHTHSSGRNPQYEPVSEDEFEGDDGDEHMKSQIASAQQEADNVGLSAFDPRIKEIREQREKYLVEHRKESEGAHKDASKAPTKDKASTSRSDLHVPMSRDDILAPSTVFDKNYVKKFGNNISRLLGSADQAGDENEADERAIRALQGRDEEEPRGSGSGPPKGVEYVTDFRTEPGKKVSVPIRVEPKVYFANERTFLKWLEFSVMVASIARVYSTSNVSAMWWALSLARSSLSSHCLLSHTLVHYTCGARSRSASAARRMCTRTRMVLPLFARRFLVSLSSTSSCATLRRMSRVSSVVCRTNE